MTPETIVIHIPIKLASVANLREHWAKKHKRAKSQRQAAALFTRMNRREWMPSLISLTRHYSARGKEMDSDNLQRACKSVRDGVADGLGILDNDPRVRWEYGQERADRTEVIVRLTP